MKSLVAALVVPGVVPCSANANGQSIPRLAPDFIVFLADDMGMGNTLSGLVRHRPPPRIPEFKESPSGKQPIALATWDV